MPSLLIRPINSPFYLWIWAPAFFNRLPKSNTLASYLILTLRCPPTFAIFVSPLFFTCGVLAKFGAFLILAPSTKCLVQSLVLSRVDYACSLFVGHPGTLLSKLQRVMNASPRLILRVRKSDSIFVPICAPWTGSVWMIESLSVLPPWLIAV